MLQSETVVEPARVLSSIEGRIRLRIEENLARSEQFNDLLERLFSQPGIEMVRFNRIINTLLVIYDPEAIEEEMIMALIANAKGVGLCSRLATRLSPIIAISDEKTRFMLARVGDVATGWQVINSLPGRVRLRHPLLYKRSKCFKAIEEDLLDTPGVKHVRVNHLTASVLVHFNESKIDLSGIVQITEKATHHFTAEEFGRDQPEPSRTMRQTTLLGSAVIGSLLMPALTLPALGLIAYCALPIFKEGIAAVKQRKVKVDILDTVVVGLSIVTGYVFAAALMVWVLDVAHAMLEKTQRESMKQLDTLFGKQPRFAWLVTPEGTEVEVAVNNLQADNRIVVSTGEIIPVDGIVHSGGGSVDQHILTGESVPVEKNRGDKAFASTLVVGGKLYITVKDVGENTTEAKLRKIVSDTAKFKHSIQGKGEKFADRMVIPTLGLGTVGYMLAGPSAGMAIVNSDYGTGIRVAAPTAMLAYIAIGAKNGVIIKNGAVLEKLSEMDAIIFDKTGTLTHDVPEVEEVVAYDQFSQDVLLRYAASAEKKFSHPIAKAILNKAEERNLKLMSYDESRYHVGRGIEVVLDRRKVNIGSEQYFRNERIKVTRPLQKQLAALKNGGKGYVLVGVDGNVAGCIALKFKVREEVKEILEELGRRGVTPYILSGDSESVTQNTARLLGIENYYAGVMPHEKQKYVEELQKQGMTVCMVGDGVNDSAALAKADISMSLSGASDIAVDVAHVVFMDGTLKKFNYLFELSERLNRNVKRSMRMMVIPNTLSIIGALSGLVTLGTSLFLNNFFIFAGVMNGSMPLGELNAIDEEHLLEEHHGKSVTATA